MTLCLVLVSYKHVVYSTRKNNNINYVIHNTPLYTCIVQKVPQSFHQGKFQSAQELDVYERMWHEHIFTGCYSNIHDEVCCY